MLSRVNCWRTGLTIGALIVSFVLGGLFGIHGRQQIEFPDNLEARILFAFLKKVNWQDSRRIIGELPVIAKDQGTDNTDMYVKAITHVIGTEIVDEALWESPTILIWQISALPVKNGFVQQFIGIGLAWGNDSSLTCFYCEFSNRH